MKKNILLAVLVGIAVLMFASCGRATSSNGSASTAALSPSNSIAASETPVAEPESSTESSAENSATPTGQETPETTVSAVDGGITLESVKKAALDAGYAAEDIPEITVQTEPVPVRGIYVNYIDETLQSQCPVYEFKSAEDAMDFARQVNDSGYSLCIVNEKLLAMTDAKYGIILHDKEQAVLESFLESVFLAYEEPASPPVNLDKDYAGAASRIERIQQALDKLVNQSVILHAKTLPTEAQNALSFITFSMVSSADLAFTAPINEDQANIDAVIQTWELYGCTDVKISHDKPHDYMMTGTRAGMDAPFAIHCMYSPEQDSVSLVDIDGEELMEFIEFVPLGNDRYAFQTLYERALVTYQDGEITSLSYSLKPRSSEFAYSPETDNIYPKGMGADDAWVFSAGKDVFEQTIFFDGTKLQISAEDFTGEKLTYDMSVPTE